MKVVGREGAQPGEFKTPTSVKIISDKLVSVTTTEFKY